MPSNYPVTNFPETRCSSSEVSQAENHFAELFGSVGNARGKVVCVQWADFAGPSVFRALVVTEHSVMAAVESVASEVSILVHWSRISGKW